MMRSVLVLVLATALHVSVNCVESSDFGYEFLTKYIEKLNQKYLNLEKNQEQLQKTFQQHWEQSAQLISTLKTQLESKNADLVQLQRQMLMLSEEGAKNAERINNQNKTFIEEIGQLNSVQNILQNQVEALEKKYISQIEEIGQLNSAQNILQNQVEVLEKNQKSIQQQLEQSEENTSTIENQTESEAPLSASPKWVPWETNTKIPDRAVLAGVRDDKMYVVRVIRDGEAIVGKVYLPFRICYIPWDGKELHYTQCEILTGSGFSWMKYSGGALPDNAFPGGRKPNGDLLYIGRVHHLDQQLQRTEPASGTIDSVGERKILTISYGGEEHQYDSFDALVVNPNFLPVSEPSSSTTELTTEIPFTETPAVEK